MCFSAHHIMIFAALSKVIDSYIRYDCVCGLATTTGTRRIVNGIITEPMKYQWMVALKKNRQPYCGAALISDSHVLTAGHCVSEDPKHSFYYENIYGKIQSHNIKKGKSVKFSGVFMHPMYEIGSQYDDFDMAILELRQPIKSFWKIRTICLPQKRKYYGGRVAKIAGWGATTLGSNKMSKHLREGEIKVLHPLQCPAATGLHNLFNFKSMICGLAKPKRIDTCQGDSGGPIFTKTRSNVYEVVGVASFGQGCGGKYAGVYASIAESLVWIKSIINTHGVCPRPSIKLRPNINMLPIINIQQYYRLIFG